MKLNFKGVEKSVWVRIIVLLMVLVNQMSVSLLSFTLIPFSDAEIYEGVSVLLTILVTIWTSWKDNPITKEAQMSNSYLKRLKGDE